MDTITVVYTKRKWQLGSFLIRWALPKSRFKNAPVSHSLIRDGEYVIEANMRHGVRRVLASEALAGLYVVEEVTYNVLDAEAGLAWAREQDGKSYDFKGAFGIALSPDRDWAEPDKWFCFELVAATLAKAGKSYFREDAGHISGNLLMAIKPNDM